MTIEETNLRTAADSYLAANAEAVGSAAAILFDEAQQRANTAEIAKNPPLPAALTTANWASLKAYLTDGGGMTDLMKVWTATDGFLTNDQQGNFFRGVLMLYKTLRRNRTGT
jgi:hypothetical protein